MKKQLVGISDRFVRRAKRQVSREMPFMGLKTFAGSITHRQAETTALPSSATITQHIITLDGKTISRLVQTTTLQVTLP